jgi:hypothetical protein
MNMTLTREEADDIAAYICACEMASRSTPTRRRETSVFDRDQFAEAD